MNWKCLIGLLLITKAKAAIESDQLNWNITTPLSKGATLIMYANFIIAGVNNGQPGSTEDTFETYSTLVQVIVDDYARVEISGSMKMLVLEFVIFLFDSWNGIQ